MQVGIIGATGFVGSLLGQRLLDRGDHLIILARNVSKAQGMFPTAAVVDWQDDRSAAAALQRCDAVINLAGRPIADPWNRKVKEEIYHSRIDTTAKLIALLAGLDRKPQVMVSASAIGYYGSSETEQFTETSPKGTGFLADVCRDWEAKADGAESLGIRLVKLRIGIVLDRGGGALGKILPLFQLGLGGILGRGTQWFSWIHRTDLVNLILFCLDRGDVRGVLNATAPQPVTNSQFTELLAQQVKRPALLPVPEFALKLALGEGASVVLEGQKVIPVRPIESGFQFTYPQVEDALAAICR